MEDAPALERLVRELLASQRLAVLSTETRGTPYSSLIVFAAAPDLTALVFATPRPTRKFSNLSENARVSLLVDNRSNREEDFAEATAGGGGFPLLLPIGVGGFLGSHIGFGGLSNTLIPWFRCGVFLRAGWAANS
jgi:hypothetical protein